MTGSFKERHGIVFIKEPVIANRIVSQLRKTNAILVDVNASGTGEEATEERMGIFSDSWLEVSFSGDTHEGTGLARGRGHVAPVSVSCVRSVVVLVSPSSGDTCSHIMSSS